MTLYFRLFLVLLHGFLNRKTRAGITAPGTLRLRVYPNDLDSNLHMNNGRYLTVMDLGRVNLILRAGLLRSVLKHKLAPTLAAVQVRYRMQLRCFQRFDLETRVLCWDEKWVYMEQRFLFVDGPKAGAVAAIALVKGGFYDRITKTTLPTSTLLGMTATPDQPSPPFPAYVRDWITAEGALRAITA